MKLTAEFLTVALLLAATPALGDHPFMKVHMEVKKPRKNGKGMATEWDEIFACRSVADCKAIGVTDKPTATEVGKKKCEELACKNGAKKFACQIYHAEADLKIAKHKGVCP